MSNRKPYYHPEHEADGVPDVRVIYRPKNQWIVQQLGAGRSTREFDPWHDVVRPQATKEEAVALMFSRFPLKPKN